MMGSPKKGLVSVIIPTRNRTEKLSRCLASVFASNYEALEVIVVDDASQEPVEQALGQRFPKVRFIRNERRRMLSCSRNAGAEASSGEYLFFLDDDNVLDPAAIGELVGAFRASNRVGVTCPIIYYLAEPNRVWTSYILRGRLPGFYGLRTEIPETTVQTFSFHNSFMVRTAVFSEIGSFDCENFPIRFSEVDFAHRLHSKGYEAVVTPRAKDWHDLGWALANIDSARAYYTERNRMIVLKRYFPKRDFDFYCVCILPFIGAYYLVHHALSSSDGGMRAAASFLRGVASGLTFDA
jgi:GT2 family glycosyltransferase